MGSLVAWQAAGSLQDASGALQARTPSQSTPRPVCPAPEEAGWGPDGMGRRARPVLAVRGGVTVPTTQCRRPGPRHRLPSDTHTDLPLGSFLTFGSLGASRPLGGSTAPDPAPALLGPHPGFPKPPSCQGHTRVTVREEGRLHPSFLCHRVSQAAGAWAVVLGLFAAIEALV